MDHGTLMVRVCQEKSPAVLVSTSHSPSDFLSAATLKNVSDKPLIGYRIGWVVVLRSGKNEVHFGVSLNLPAGIEPGETWDAPGQSVSPDHAREGASAVAFFVAEVYLSGEQPWKEDIAQVRKKARRAAVQS